MSSIGKKTAALAEFAGPPKGLWDTIIITTPVVLTVVATLLAGVSSSEMTQAQYHRSLAAQNQSKASDQWGFFQAKRGRATSERATADVLAGLSDVGAVSGTELLEALERLVEKLMRAEQESERLNQRIAAAKSSLGQTQGTMQAKAESFLQSAKKKFEQATALRKQLADSLGAPSTADALRYLNNGELPAIEDKSIDDGKIKAALALVEARQGDSDPGFLQVDEKTLQEAIACADGNAQAFSDACKPFNQAIDRLEKQVQQVTSLARSLAREGRRATESLGNMSAGETKEVQDLIQSAQSLNLVVGDIKLDADELGNSFVTAKHQYTARRYDRDAAYNQDVAKLYEVQVRRSGMTSERHRERSKLFFFCMLAAQAGVTISSLAMAAKQRSLMWSLASLAGLSALAFSAYVYLLR